MMQYMLSTALQTNSTPLKIAFLSLPSTYATGASWCITTSFLQMTDRDFGKINVQYFKKKIGLQLLAKKLQFFSLKFDLVTCTGQLLAVSN